MLIWQDFAQHILTNLEIKTNLSTVLYFCTKLDCIIYILPRKSEKRKSLFYLDLWERHILECFYPVVLWLLHYNSLQSTNPQLIFKLDWHNPLTSYTGLSKWWSYNFLYRDSVWILAFEIHYFFSSYDRPVDICQP